MSALADTLDAVLDRMVPADEDGPGAAEAGVGTYVRTALRGPYTGDRETYRDGLDALDARATQTAGVSFARLGPAAQDALLAELEHGAFFELVRRHAIEGLFGDPAWGGNAGGAGWALLGYPGPRAAWSAADQDLDAAVEPSRVDVTHASLPGAPRP